MSQNLVLSGAPQAQSVVLTLLARDQNGIAIQYTTFDTNKPKTYGNTLYVWQASGPVIPWGLPFTASTPIDTDQYLAPQRLNFPYQVSLGYIVGYAVAPDPNAIVDSLFIPPNNAPTESTPVTIGLGSYGNQYVQSNYSTLDKYNPSANKNWVGIWNGPRAGYDGIPLAKADVPFPNTAGSVTIMGTNILIGATYTIGYFMAALPPGKTALAAQYTFNT
jgi:hypothetical protein